MPEDGRVGVLFVCTGNICRSPTAQGQFEKLINERRIAHRFHVDSVGIEDYHIGAAPDSRSIQAAKTRGIALAHLQARQLSRADFAQFDFLLAMDSGHLRHLRRQMPAGLVNPPKLALLLDYASGFGGQDVPDPYYGGPQDFERVLDLVEAGCEGLYKAISEANFQKKFF
jgi:protein-tyrosine phosphatase